TTLTLGCNPSASDITAALGTATATDACGIPTLTFIDGAISTTSCSASQTRTFTAVDACGNTATAVRTVTWTSAPNPPAIIITGAIPTLGCNPSASDINAALGSATATAACGTPAVIVTDGQVQSNGCSLSQTRTFSAADGCGNSATASATVTWTSDLVPPTITTTGTTLTLGCNPSASDITAALGTATATDACGIPTLTFIDGPVTGSCTQTQTRTFSAVDACGNTATAVRTITWTSDLVPPTITTTGTTLTLGCNPSASDITAALGTATATDACGIPTLTFIDGAISTTSCSASQTRTFTAVDACGNTATVVRTVTWTDAPNPPAIIITGAIPALGCNPSAPDISAALGSATATAACGTPAVIVTDGQVQSNGCSLSQTRTFSAADGCGNSATASSTVTWTSDLVPPTITTSGTTLTLGCNPSASDITAALGTATATDACGIPTLTFIDGPVTGSCTQTQTRTFSAVDACGNTATAVRTVTWTSDLVPPTITTTGTTLTLGCNPS